MARATFKRKGLDTAEIGVIVPQLMQALLERVDVLSQWGFDQLSIYQQASDFEDAQIAAAARSLPGQRVCVVTADKTFDTLAEVLLKTPQQVLAWINAPNSEETEQTQTIPFVELPVQKAQIRPILEQNIETVPRHGQCILGPEVRELEQQLAVYTGARHGISVASGTEALLISLMALGIGPGDEVITTPFTFVATAEVIGLLGARRSSSNIEPDTGNIDARLIEAKITGRTKAILPSQPLWPAGGTGYNQRHRGPPWPPSREKPCRPASRPPLFLAPCIIWSHSTNSRPTRTSVASNVRRSPRPSPGKS